MPILDGVASVGKDAGKTHVTETQGTSGKPQLSFTDPKLFGFGVFLSIACLWIAAYPPIVDLPQHSAQIAALQEIWAGNQTFTDTFELNWFAPYSFTYLVFYLLAVVLPITVAGKLLLSLSVAAVPIVGWKLLKETDSDPAWAWTKSTRSIRA